MKYSQFAILTLAFGLLWMPAPVDALSIYYAADKPPSDNAPAEAPLCYKFEVASLEEQLGKLKVKYPNLYDEKIVNNPDGSRSLLAKRKAESGEEIHYFYSNNPAACTEYQQTHLDKQMPTNLISPAQPRSYLTPTGTRVNIGGNNKDTDTVETKPTFPTIYPVTESAYSSSSSSSSRSIHTGPRGGRYYYNSKGNKTYIKRK